MLIEVRQENNEKAFVFAINNDEVGGALIEIVNKIICEFGLNIVCKETHIPDLETKLKIRHDN